MNRSEINTLLDEAKSFFAAHKFQLPPWAFWGPDAWRGKQTECAEIIENMLGWDITDFGLDAYREHGLLLFTIRNGNPKRDKKTYAEKVMLVKEDQETPMHFHWQKMEDIINRGGGNLVLEIYGSDEKEDFSDQPVQVSVDGITRQVEPGGVVVLTPGESICLTQGMYHRFYAEPGKGMVLVGEVSQVNDDVSDNRFHVKVGRFPDIVEDTQPVHLLCSEYKKYV